ncbi:hypothetical protein O181_026135 [Austropuccinia psidii MF-1]|uniref:Uncharacterized protein n=1 Tax=Austropuccinia psidii MF-1 TaxID=1389203 RepID=A0A9Q3CNV3_9BASI|nr:hypothetical protein [Austropuccinia psidii MF-1]
MKEMIMPSGSKKIPFNLGASKDGRLKAAQWLSLFTLVIPIIIPEMFVNHSTIDMKSNQGKFLQSTGYLVQCTRIVCAKMIQEGHAGRFYRAYNHYTDSSKAFFNNPKIKPNRHYALHISKQIKLWGPFMGVAEFSGERIIDEIHGTIMKKTRESQMLVAGKPKLSSSLDTAKHKQWGIGNRGIEVSKKSVSVNVTTAQEKWREPGGL